MFSDVTVINLSEELKHLQRTNDEQKEKISEYERQIENKGRNFFSKLKQELQNKYLYKYNTYSHKNMSPNKILVVIPEDLYISH